MLTQLRVRELFNYNPITGHLVRKITTSNNGLQGSIVGSRNTLGYLRVSINNISYYVHRVIWLWCYGYMPEHILDHINRNPADNRLTNLREVSDQCNVRNTCNRCDNISNIKGVSYDTKNHKWRVNITVDSKTVNLGRYRDFDEAVCTRLAAEQCLDWAGCDSESPAFKYVRDTLCEVKI